MRAALCVVLILTALPAGAAPERSPRPMPRPVTDAAAVVAAPSGTLRPVLRPVTPVPPPSGICGVTGLSGTHLPPVTSDVPGCGIADPVEVTAVQGVALSMPLTIDCSIGRAVNEWVRTVLKPTFENRIRQIDVAGAYACRGRNNVEDAKISEHGKGRAIDISGLTFTDGSSVTVARDWNTGRDGTLLTRAYHAGCGIFGTTLGPGSDGYHEDHMHFDMPSNRRSPYCR